ncbi:pectinesterase precursor [Apiospora arundinis]
MATIEKKSPDGVPRGDAVNMADVEKLGSPPGDNRLVIADGEDILALQDTDPALNMKMHLVNNAIDEIGWTTYHWKLFVLNGFGYGVDSLILLLQSVISTQAFWEFGEKGYSAGLTVAVYVGMLTGAIFWGMSADIIGRKWAFNISLFICSSAAIVAGAAPNWPSLGFFIALVGFGGGGNLILDTTVFLEYLPSNKQWVLTLMACWWGLGQAITGFIAWGFLVPGQWNCASADNCPKASNWGWRYTMFTAGALVFVMSVLRITIIRLKETPKYLLGIGEDAELVEALQALAAKYNRPCSLTLDKLEACGTIQSAHSKNRISLGEITVHLKGLFGTKKIALSTSLIWFSWTLIGLAYPLFYVFLNQYLKSRGATTGVSTYDTWRNYALTNVSGIFGPVIAGWMCNQRLLGRKYTMTVGALVTMAFFFAYTAVRTPAQNVGFSCAIGVCLNIYYGTLYAYTPEVLPSAHRATGNGIAVACNRIMGIISAAVGTSANTGTTAPIYVCAALFAGLAIISVIFPFEPYGRRSS